MELSRRVVIILHSSYLHDDTNLCTSVKLFLFLFLIQYPWYHVPYRTFFLLSTKRCAGDDVFHNLTMESSTYNKHSWDTRSKHKFSTKKKNHKANLHGLFTSNLLYLRFFVMPLVHVDIHLRINQKHNKTVFKFCRLSVTEIFRFWYWVTSSLSIVNYPWHLRRSERIDSTWHIILMLIIV